MPKSWADFARWSYLRVGVGFVGIALWVAVIALRHRWAWVEPFQWVAWALMMASSTWQIVANLKWRKAHSPQPSYPNHAVQDDAGGSNDEPSRKHP